MAGGIFAGGSYLSLGYSMQGFLPSVAATSLLLTGVALMTEAWVGRDARLGIACGFVIGAAVDVYSISVGVYFVLPAVACLVWAVWRSRRTERSLRRDVMVAFGIIVASLVAAAPYGADAWRFFRASATSTAASTGSGSVSDLGNLFHPISYQTVFGSWIGPDYRLDYNQGAPILGAASSAGLTRIGIAVGAFLLLISVTEMLIRRRGPLLIALASPTVAALFIYETRSPYYTAKSYQVLSVFVIAAAIIGAHRLAGSPRTMRAFLSCCTRARGAVVLTLLIVWALAAARSNISEARSASATSDMIRTDLPGLATATVGYRTVLLTRPQIAGQSLWSRLALPAAFGGELKPRTPGFRPLDTDTADPGSTRGADALVEYAVGGLSIPPPPFRLARESGLARLYLAPRGTQATPPMPFESGNEVGAHRVGPGFATEAAVGDAKLVRIGVLDPDNAYLPLAFWRGQNGIWRPWDADPYTRVPVGNGAPLSTDIAVTQGGQFKVTGIGRFVHTRLVVDGTSYLFNGGDIGEPTTVATIHLPRGLHRLELYPSDPREVSFASAVAIERVGGNPPTSVFCVGHDRYRVRPSAPVIVSANAPNLKILNCGNTPLALDWWQPVNVSDR